MVSDEEYSAALALEVFSTQMINKGRQSTNDFTLEENIQYTTLIIDYESQSETIARMPTSDKEVMVMSKIIKLIRLKGDSLLEKFCR